MKKNPGHSLKQNKLPSEEAPSAEKIPEMEARVEVLQQQLARERLKSEAYYRLMKIAEHEFQIEVKPEKDKKGPA